MSDRLNRRRRSIATGVLPAVLLPLVAFAHELELPLERTTYFAGELVPMAISGGEMHRLEAVNADGATLLYAGAARVLLVDTTRLAPGSYQLHLDGADTQQKFVIVSTLRRSAGSMQDESSVAEPQIADAEKLSPANRAELTEAHYKPFLETLDESGLTAIFAPAQSDVGRVRSLDYAARAGVMLLTNPDTRPTSFFPIGNEPGEVDGMSQRMILGAQANARYPNFGGYLFGWDTTGYGTGNRRGLLTYWGWGDKTQALRNYISRIDRHTQDEFRRRSGMEPVSEAEYIAYLASIGRPEFATAIDLPTRHWLFEISKHSKPMGDSERAAFEKRLDAWSAYLMGLYAEAYSSLAANLRKVDPALRNTASVQVDHAAVRNGQYFPSAYAPLDFQYQSTWNDQVGGPDYAYQWLYTAGLLDMRRGNKPTWLSNSFGAVHARADVPGKFVRVAAHGLPWGVSGIGFACEGFSSIVGGMNKDATWSAIRGHAGQADVDAGREFLDRFACLAVEGRGDHGVGILFSKSQYQRQHVVMGFGSATYQAFVILTRLGYTPRFVTEEDLIESGGKLDVKSLLVIGQTFPVSSAANEAIGHFAHAGTTVLVDDSSTVEFPSQTKLGYAFAFTQLGKPHNWMAPNMAQGDNDSFMFARWYAEIAPLLAKALGDRGRGLLTPELGVQSDVSLLQIDGGADAKYIIAVNDSHQRTQADWHQVREQLVPTANGDAAPDAFGPGKGWLFDCTDEKSIGRLGTTTCDLTSTTARVFAVLAREPVRIDVRAAQRLAAGSPLPVAVRFVDPQDRPLNALVPFCLTVCRPDGKVFVELYRSTDRAGRFAIDLPLPLNTPRGKWTVSVRCQLNGALATVPFEVIDPPQDGSQRELAAPLPDALFVRQGTAAEPALAPGSKIVLPLFGTAAEKLRPAAERVKQVLAARGVEVEVRLQPELGTYWLAYELTAEQKAENARVDNGELFGRIRRETVNDNDWFSALGKWRFGKPLILLDVSSEPAMNPLSTALAQAGVLWPTVTAAFPGPGRATFEAVRWAFGPRITTLVLRANDLEGVMRGAESLAKLPQDRLTPRIEGVKSALWQQFHVGGRPQSAEKPGLTANGLAASNDSRPFAIRFPGKIPIAAAGQNAVSPDRQPAVALPAKFEPKQFVIFLRDGENYVESDTAEPLVPDLRFSDAIQLTIDVPAAAKYRLTVSGVFRYSDRKPCWQAQWEELIDLLEKFVPKQRLPMSIEVRLDGREATKLSASKVESKEVPLELASPSAGLKPRAAVEEVVTQLLGEIDLPAGRHKLLLIHRHIVDGKVESVELSR